MLRSLLTDLRKRLRSSPGRLQGGFGRDSEVTFAVTPRDARRENIEHLTAVLKTLLARGMSQAEIGQAILHALETEDAGSTPPSPQPRRLPHRRRDVD